MSQTDWSITPQASGSAAPLRVASRNPFRSRLAPQDAGAPATSISNSVVENRLGNIGERSALPPIVPPRVEDGPRSSIPNPTVEQSLPPLPPRKVGTLNSAASLAVSTTYTQPSTTLTVSPSPLSSSSASPPESFSRIFTPPSGPPPTHTPRNRPALSPQSLSSSSASPPESLSSIFTPPSGPPPTQTLIPGRTFSPPPASSPLRRSQTPPPLPSRRTTLRISSPSPPRASRGRRLRSNSSETMRVLAEDLPPAYTPGPDTRQGERTVDIGPVRPFIQDDTAALEESLRRRQQMGSMSGFPGATQQQAWGYGGGGRGGRGQMSLSGLLIELLTGGVRNSPGRSQHRPNLLDNPISRAATHLAGTTVPPQPTSGPHISRPPTVTPPIRTSNGRWDQYPGQRDAPRNILHVPPPPVHPQNWRSSPSTHVALPEIQQPVTWPTDPRPTARATPGRPLLYDGQVLVYPLGYECPKCHNRGYRPTRGLAFQGIPSALVPGDLRRPCRKCWSRYARYYEGPLVYADWEGNINGTGGTNYQRPISDPPPMLEPAALAPSPSPTHPRTPSTTSLRSNHVMTDGPAAVFTQRTGRTPRSTTVVRPGDPRLGGRLCWKCNGTGEVTVFIFDQERCRVCGGTGRIM